MLRKVGECAWAVAKFTGECVWAVAKVTGECVWEMYSAMSEYLTDASYRTWFVHGAVSCSLTYGVAGVVLLLARMGHIDSSVDLAAWVLGGGTFWWVFYLGREALDRRKHKRLGEWEKRANEDQVTWKTDGRGDLVGPFTNWLCSIGVWWVL